MSGGASPETSRDKLITLEAGRFFAALAVMLFHYTNVLWRFRGEQVFDDVFRGGHAGVPYFFILSGFVIYHAHEKDLGRPKSIPRFALRRAIRLLPMFWAVSGVMLAGFLLVPSLSAERSLSFAGVIADFLLLPHADAVLAISWTLRHEVIFYAIFALALWRGPRMLALVVVWGAVSVINAGMGLHDSGFGSWTLISSALNLGFALGIVIAVLTKKNVPVSPGLCIIVGGGLLSFLAIMEWHLGHGMDTAIEVLGAVKGTVAYLVAAGLMIYGLAKSESGWKIRAPGLWRLLGGSSYLLYLIHPPIASLAIRVIPLFRTMPTEMVFLLLASATVAAAIGLHVVIERQLLAYLSAKIRSLEQRVAGSRLCAR